MQGPCANRLRCLCGLSVLLLAPKLSFARDSAVVKQADAPAALERTTDGTGPYAARPSAGALLEKTSRGEIDWTDGYVVAYGRARLIKGPDPGICSSIARRAAILGARARALEILQGMNLDGGTTVKVSVSKNQRLLYELKGLIARAGAFDQQEDKGFYNVKIKVPLYGVHGVQDIFLDEYGKSNAGVGQSVPTRRVVIDARGTGLRPALFVKIKDQTGRDIYTARDVSMSRLQDRGMAEYVTSTATEQGDVVVRALSAAGPEHSDIVVSFADADRLTGADGALPGGNVVIIADPPTE